MYNLCLRQEEKKFNWNRFREATSERNRFSTPFPVFVRSRKCFISVKHFWLTFKGKFKIRYFIFSLFDGNHYRDLKGNSLFISTFVAYYAIVFVGKELGKIKKKIYEEKLI